MATTHSPSRRQRPPRRTTASMAHARHRSAGARQNRTTPETIFFRINETLTEIKHAVEGRKPEPTWPEAA